MGSCLSKSKRPDDKTASKTTTGNTRFTKVEQRLGTNNESQLHRNGHHIVSEESSDEMLPAEKIAKTGTRANFSGGGKKLGGDAITKETLSAKEVVARAAEERFNKQQEQLKDSKDKLKTMSKLSKAEKGL